MNHVVSTHSRYNVASETGAQIPALDFQPLNRVIYRPGALSQLGELAREFGGTRAMLVTDPGLEKAGHPQRATEILREAGVEVFLFDDVEENPTTKHVDLGVAFATKHSIDMIISVGGGSSMDCGKGVNFILTNGGRMNDYKGFGHATKPMLPSIGIPTTTGTGSEAQSFALIADEKTHLKMACGDRKVAFRACILDPELTVSQPRQVAAVTGVDAISHALESYVCKKRNPLASLFAKEAFRLLEGNLEASLEQTANLDYRGAMQLGAHFAGMAIENSMLGAAHACANPLTAHYGITHGIAVGIMLPHVIRFNGSAVSSLYRDLAREVGSLNGDRNAPAEMLANRVKAICSGVGLPTRLDDCGVSESILPLLAEEASQQWTGKFNPVEVGEPELLELYRMAW